LAATSQYAKIFLVGVISRKKIRDASKEHPEWEASSLAWYKVAKSADWAHFLDVKQSWKNSDNVGSCVVFDISHNMIA